MYHDTRMWDILEENPNAGVSWYLMAAYVYYHLNNSIISDGAFDKLSKWLMERWNTIEHGHKHLITMEDLESGGLLLAEEKYPSITKDAATRMLNQNME